MYSLVKIFNFPQYGFKSWKKCIKSDLEEIFLKLATDDWSEKMFLLTSKFHPQGVVTPALGLYTCIKLWKQCIKSDFKEIFFLTGNQWLKWQEVSVDIKILSPGVVCPWPAAIYNYYALGLYTCIKLWKKMYKVRLQRDFFFTCNKWLKWQENSVDIKILTPGVVCPWPAAIYNYYALGLYTCIKLWKKCIKSDFKEIFFL